MKVVTWNVNGIRAREAQLLAFVLEEEPDVVCLQEIKARPDQIPASLVGMERYWCGWHGAGGYSGVALLVRRELSPVEPNVLHPPFDVECRVATVEIGGILFASVYVPNGGKDFPAKMRFLEGMARWTAEVQSTGRPIVLCGDLNVALTDMDVHPREKKPGIVGQRPEERVALQRVIDRGLVDVLRAQHPDDDRLFTWWAPWRNLRERNIGWRIDYILASDGLAVTTQSCVSRRDFGTSDHAPVVAVFER
ncbi:MAG: exodeoxyribonuclease III [Deltaproteobacteria bacterium]|nr:exodeoxyribonuclease III [Deltaproteobacteria bacterium]